MYDIEMMNTVGLSICRENSCAEVKKIVNDICLSVTLDGLAKAFEKYFMKHKYIKEIIITNHL